MYVCVYVCMYVCVCDLIYSLLSSHPSSWIWRASLSLCMLCSQSRLKEQEEEASKTDRQTDREEEEERLIAYFSHSLTLINHILLLMLPNPPSSLERKRLWEDYTQFMGMTETDSKGPGLAPSQSMYLELHEKSEHPVKEVFLPQDGILQGGCLSIQPERHIDVLANRQPNTVPMVTEANGKDLPPSSNGGLTMMSGLYCTEGTINAFTASSGLSATIVSHGNDIRPPMVNNATSHKQRPWISQKPQTYQARNFEPSKEMTTTAHTPVRVARPPPGGGKSQLLPRYWPRMTDQELQLLTLKDSNATITPLFEKVLSASDAGRVGRLVLPKACAEAYFPPISQAEGLPLSVRDIDGKEWVFQFRFWPNNNSRMYVLEGITPCIQSMQLQAGDTVIFYRLDPEGKLVMGNRRAPHAPTAEEAQKAMTSASGGIDKASIGPKKRDISRSDASHTNEKRKSKDGTKSKRIRLDAESIEFKKNWEEAQSLLQSPPNVLPSIVTIEGYDFEEYEDPPVFGKPITISAVSPSRSASVGNPQHDVEFSKPTLQSQNVKDLRKQEEVIEPLLGSELLSGLETLATLATVEENDSVVSSSSQATTTKHPRHRPGCSCIVCIQPPSGKGPKHKPNCDCNVCMTVKRRFHTLMLRRKKLQSEREAENAAQKNKISATKDEMNNGVRRPSPHDTNLSSKMSSWQGSSVVQTPFSGVLVSPRISEGFCNGINGLSLGGLGFPPVGKFVKVEYDQAIPSKGPQIDLNIQPEREDEVNRGCSMKSLLQSASYPLDIYLKQQGLTSLVSNPNHQNNNELPSESSFLLLGKKVEEQDQKPSLIMLNNSKSSSGEPHVPSPNLDQSTG